VYSILSAKKIRQSIDVLDLTGIAHVPPMWALCQFVTQVRHRNVGTILLKQALDPVLPAAAALVAYEAHHLLEERKGDVETTMGTVPGLVSYTSHGIRLHL
jgi:hypothetical protein